MTFLRPLLPRWTWLTLLGLMVIVTACSGGGEEGTQAPTLTVTPKELNLPPGVEGRALVRGGYPPYRAGSDAPSQLSVRLDNRELVVSITPPTSESTPPVSGSFSGTAWVQDSRGNRATVNVRLSAEALSVGVTSPVILPPGTPEQGFRIFGGSPPFTATSSTPSLVAVRTQGNHVWIRPLAVGTAQVSVYDAFGRSTSFEVRVGSAAPLRAYPTAVTLPLDASYSIFISGGLPPYRAVTNHPGAIQVSVADNTVSLRATALISDAQLTIIDAANSEVQVGITVASVQPGFSVLPTRVRVSETSGDVLTFQVRGAASGAVSAYSSHLNLATVQAPTFTGGTGTITVQMVGSNACVPEDTDVTLTVVDAAGATATSIITVTNVANTLDDEGNLLSACPPPSP